MRYIKAIYEKILQKRITMNKFLICVAFCTLNSHAMNDPFGGLLDPERIVEAAVSDIFSGPLPVVVRPASQNPIAPTEPCPDAQLPCNLETTASSTRSSISFAQAIMSGTFHAFEHKEKGKVIEFEDFENGTRRTAQLFCLPMELINPLIYAFTKKYEEASCSVSVETSHALRFGRLLTDEKILEIQAPLFLAFLNYTDLNTTRKKEIEKIYTDDNLSKKEKKAQAARVEKLIEDALKNRALYFAALATQDPNAINNARKKGFKNPLEINRPITEYIAQYPQHGYTFSGLPTLAEAGESKSNMVCAF